MQMVADEQDQARAWCLLGLPVLPPPIPNQDLPHGAPMKDSAVVERPDHFVDVGKLVRVTSGHSHHANPSSSTPEEGR